MKVSLEGLRMQACSHARDWYTKRGTCSDGSPCIVAMSLHPAPLSAHAAQLVALSGKLTEAGVLHKLWVEQPENYPTCLATKPYPKSAVALHFKKLNLCKAAFTA